MNYIELQFQCQVACDRCDLPPYLGATLRGAFGYLLKQTVCQVAHGNCSKCLLQQACPYPSIFEGLAPPYRSWMRKYPFVPQPFVLVTQPPGESGNNPKTLDWGIRLFGPACRFWPYVIHVFQMAGQQGIGQSKVKYEIVKVLDGVTGQVVHPADNDSPAVPAVRELVSGESNIPEVSTLKWTFHTPTRLTEKHPCQIDGLSLLLAGKRRFQTLMHFYGNADSLPLGERVEAEDFRVESHNLHKYRFSRFSGRQKQKMELQGILGHVVISGPWGRFSELLHALPIIHIGKSTSFGFGRITWEIV